ncbi:hypothetical protein F2Q69_00031101 [Brassica cretica]|uniref:Uncharacterized protein n=1 Tax=Brassica cretica TaxID=69181 RepID=A0A3N6QRP3_BRACR|nr:hypothetical protein F2Q69_00031101 [Brassica cretica]
MLSCRPREILDTIKSGEDFRIATTTKMPEQGTCERRGYISSQLRKLQEKTLSYHIKADCNVCLFGLHNEMQKWCKACVLLDGLNRVCLRWVSEEREEA